MFQNKSFSQTYYFKSEKKFCHFNKSIRLKNKSREFREYQTIVSVTETYSKMALTLCQICQKAKNRVYIGPYDFVQISPACGPNTYQIMYGLTSDF